MKKALLVGINKYPDSPLRGCVNDCILMYKVLSEKFLFDKKDICLITDNECTKNNIIQKLKWLTSNTKPGDLIFFHYSGHGSQVVVNDWTNTSEADGLDEILCPIDLDWNNPLRDNDLNSIFKAVPCGVKIVVILDCCHSGSGLRNYTKKDLEYKTNNDWVNRFLPPPPSNILSNPKISISDKLCFITPKYDPSDIQTHKNSFLVDTIKQGDAILISGCGENQTSADAWIWGKYHGALTYYLVDTLKEFKFKVKYSTLVKTVNKKLRNRMFRQISHLECKREFFESNFLS